MTDTYLVKNYHFPLGHLLPGTFNCSSLPGKYYVNFGLVQRVNSKRLYLMLAIYYNGSG